ncbi:methyltransferase [Streptomyces sp. NPDC007904]|uniref:methyltransferase n=1 Tax=Streptomyces sp. NPDC007904 TaxID=3364787 RepID=UPI0036EFFA8B
MDVTAHHVTGPAPHGRIPIGRPITGARVHVLDGGLREQPVGVAGELFIGGIPLARGYHGRPALTAERFLPAPFTPDGRLYRTGDLVRWRPDSTIEYLGRLDHQVKIRGQRIEPAEIEAALCRHPAVAQALVTTVCDTTNSPQLAAYVTKSAGHSSPDTHDRDRDRDGGDRDGGGDRDRDGGGGRQVDQWSEVFDQIYEMGKQHNGDVSFDISGWISSYTGEPLGADEMRSWVDSVVTRVLALPHRRILEIGCGTGLLLFPLAAHAELYHATDVSEVALRGLRAQLPLLPPGSARIALEQRAADNFDALPDDGYDTVLINSVAQYFPDADYLADVLTKALRVVRPGGAVTIGDVRNLALQRALHTSLAITADGADATSASFAQDVTDRIAQDAALVIDPAFFTAPAADRPEIDSVSLLAKQGGHANELVKYRYDAILHLAEAPSAPPNPPPPPAPDPAPRAVTPPPARTHPSTGPPPPRRPDRATAQRKPPKRPHQPRRRRPQRRRPRRRRPGSGRRSPARPARTGGARRHNRPPRRPRTAPRAPRTPRHSPHPLRRARHPARPPAAHDRPPARLGRLHQRPPGRRLAQLPGTVPTAHPAPAA